MKMDLRRTKTWKEWESHRECFQALSSEFVFPSRSSSASRRRWSHPGSDHLLEIWLLTLKLKPHRHTHTLINTQTRTSVAVHLQQQASRALNI